MIIIAVLIASWAECGNAEGGAVYFLCKLLICSNRMALSIDFPHSESLLKVRVVSLQGVLVRALAQ